MLKLNYINGAPVGQTQKGEKFFYLIQLCFYISIKYNVSGNNILIANNSTQYYKMQTTDKPEVKVRTYFLQQGQSIGRLHDILNSNLLTGTLKRGISILLELVLFVLFLAILLLVIYIPLDPIQIEQALSESTTATATIHNDDVMALMMVIKAALFTVALMPLILMVLMRRNRRKSALIHQAFEEVAQMKQKFDEAVKTLEL